MVRGGGEVVGRVRQLEGRLGMESVELGGDCGDRGNGGGSLVSCSSGERRSSLGATAPAVPGRREDVREVRAVEGFRLTRFEGRGILTGVGTDGGLRQSTARSKGGGRELRCVLG